MLRTFALALSSLWETLRARLRRGPLRPSWSFGFEFGVTFMRRFSLRTFALTSAEAQRRAWESLVMPSPLDRKVRRERVDAGGVPGEWFTPVGDLGPDAPVVLYFHGGSFIYGSTRTHGELLCRIALSARARVLGINYRCAPEHPFPAPVDDAFAAYRWLLASGVAAERIVVAGDSAGGTLTATTLLQAREGQVPLPAGAVLICPWVDVSARGGSLTSNEPYDWAEQHMFATWARTYAGDDVTTHRNPLVSPLFATLRGMPPLLVQVGAAEMLLDQVTAFAEKARAEGVDARLKVWPDMVHNWHIFAAVNASSLHAIEEIGAFVAERTKAHRREAA